MCAKVAAYRGNRHFAHNTYNDISEAKRIGREYSASDTEYWGRFGDMCGVKSYIYSLTSSVRADDGTIPFLKELFGEEKTREILKIAVDTIEQFFTSGFDITRWDRLNALMKVLIKFRETIDEKMGEDVLKMWREKARDMEMKRRHPQARLPRTLIRWMFFYRPTCTHGEKHKKRSEMMSIYSCALGEDFVQHTVTRLRAENPDLEKKIQEMKDEHERRRSIEREILSICNVLQDAERQADAIMEPDRVPSGVEDTYRFSCLNGRIGGVVMVYAVLLTGSRDNKIIREFNHTNGESWPHFFRSMYKMYKNGYISKDQIITLRGMAGADEIPPETLDLMFRYVELAEENPEYMYCRVLCSGDYNKDIDLDLENDVMRMIFSQRRFKIPHKRREWVKQRGERFYQDVERLIGFDGPTEVDRNPLGIIVQAFGKMTEEEGGLAYDASLER